MKISNVSIIGCGERGLRYFKRIKTRQDFRVVGVWDVDRGRMAEPAVDTGIQMRSENDLRGADAVIVATSDGQHLQLAYKFARLGLPVLLEKPICGSFEELDELEAQPDGVKNLLFVAHGLRYTAYSRRIRELVAAGALGQVLGFQHAEPVTFSHYAHAYVRGKWAETSSSGPLLLTKACHDIDLVEYWTGRLVTSVVSMANLSYYHSGNAPENASTNCHTCDLRAQCIFSSERYLSRLEDPSERGRLGAIADPNGPYEEFQRALYAGPYGRCVYHSRNDVADSQVVVLQLDTGAVASVTVVGASRPPEGRRTTIFGSAGELVGNEASLIFYDHASGNRQVEKFPFVHDGALDALLDEFAAFIAESGDTKNLQHAIRSHRIALCAEQSRVLRRFIDVPGP